MKALLVKFYLGLRSALLNFAGILLRPALAAAPKAPRRILFIRIDRLGDLVLSTPAFRAIKEKFPSAELSVLAAPGPAGLLEGNPNVDKIYLWEPGKGAAALFSVVKELRAAGFDLAIDPYCGYELKTAFITFLCGAPLRAGYEGHGRGIFFNLRAEPAGSGHFVEEAFGILNLLGIARRLTEPELFVTPQTEAAAAGILQGAGVLAQGLFIAVHPGGYYPSQRWPAERFASVIRALIAGHNAKIMLIGSSAETRVLESVLAGLSPTEKKSIISVVDQKADVLCALIGRSGLFIGNNSGPLHMAGALKVPSVSTMGPTDPVKWAPLGPKQIVLKTELPCVPRGKEYMLDITVEKMLESAEKLLGGKQADTL